MKNKRFLFFIYITLCISSAVFSQSDNSISVRLRELESQIANATTEAKKLNYTAHLGRYYLDNGNKRKADSTWDALIQTADRSGDKGLLSQAYKDVGYEYINIDNNVALSYLLKAVEIAGSSNLKNEELFAVQALSVYYRMLGSYEKALESLNQVDLNDRDITDSARCEFYVEKSFLYESKGEILNSFKNSFKAKHYAEKSGSQNIIRYALHSLALKYMAINNHEKALAYISQIQNGYNLEKKYHESKALDVLLASLYHRMGNRDRAESICTGIIHYADSIKDNSLKYQGIFTLFNLYYNSNIEKFLTLEKKFQMSEYLKDIGVTPGYYSIKAKTCSLEGNTEKEEYFLLKAISSCDSTNNSAWKVDMLNSTGSFYRQRSKHEKSLLFLLQSLALNDSLKILTNYPIIYEELDSTYIALGDFSNAYNATKKYHFYKDSLEKLGRTEDILREEIAEEEESMKKTEEADIKAIERKHDIQYRFIILGAILLLIGLLAIGFFHPPKWLVRGLAFVSFIFIFEFIILILDSKLHHWFHGAPLPILATKVLIACLLVPLHHLVEKKVIHFLQSKKLHRLKTVFKDEPVKSV